MDAQRWQQIDSIFQAALERAPQERAAFLDEVCSGDHHLRSDVEAMLSSDEQGWELLEGNAFEAAADLLAEEQPDLSAGDEVGHYRVLDLLGVGGMGQVYLAEDRRLGRKVALKLLPASFTRRGSRLLRFQQEARAASALNHPNIVTIYDIWEIEGRHLIATEYIEGETLRERIKRGKLEAEEALDVSIQVASALWAAHQAGIAHLDIKPENIMLRRDGYVKVLDFGLAKLTERESLTQNNICEASAETDVTPSLVTGTVKYMSPEQARGLTLDVRSDIFSLGIVTYEMLAGRTPFNGETTIGIIASLLKEEPAPLSRFIPDLPVELERVISRALSKNRDERYQTVNDLLVAMKEILREVGDRPSLRAIGRGGQSRQATTDHASAVSGLLFIQRAAKAIRQNTLLAVSTLLVTAVIAWLILYNSSRLARNDTGAANELNAARVKAGDLDPTFGAGGKVITRMSQESGNDDIQTIALQSDGRIIAVGPAWRGDTNKDFGVVRYNLDGTLDDTFGTGGKVVTNISNINNEDIAFAVAIQPDGRAVVAGFAFNGSEGPDFALARYNTDGSLDMTFGAGGKTVTPLGGDDKVLGLVIQGDGKIVAAGHASTDFALVRYNTDGSPDRSFGKGGKVITDVSAANLNDNAFDLALQEDGRIIACGFIFDRTTGGDTALVRYNTDGSLDTSFGTGGKVIINLSPINGHDHAYQVAIQPDNKIVAVGNVNNGSTGRDFAVIRLNADGSLDTSFGKGGIVTTDVDGQDTAHAIALQPDGCIIAAGYCADFRDYALARYNGDGGLDPSFGKGGIVIANISPTNGGDAISSLALWPDGRLIAAGSAYNGTDNDFALARFDVR
jgi:uncharacterized delta-60 repeat protein